MRWLMIDNGMYYVCGILMAIHGSGSQLSLTTLINGRVNYTDTHLQISQKYLIEIDTQPVIYYIMEQMGQILFHVTSPFFVDRREEGARRYMRM